MTKPSTINPKSWITFSLGPEERRVIDAYAALIGQNNRSAVLRAILGEIATLRGISRSSLPGQPGGILGDNVEAQNDAKNQK